MAPDGLFAATRWLRSEVQARNGFFAATPSWRHPFVDSGGDDGGSAAPPPWPCFGKLHLYCARL